MFSNATGSSSTSSSSRTAGGVVLKTMIEIINEALPSLHTLTNQTAVLVVGASKSGKSTLINYLLGNKFLPKPGLGRRTIAELAAGETLHAPMGSSLDSTTLAPHAYEKNGIVYCDTPGFDDTREREKRVCAVGCTKAGVSLLTAIQTLVVVIDVAALFGEANANSLKTLSHHLSQVINIAEFSPNVLFALTKPNNSALDDVMQVVKELVNNLKNKLKSELNSIKELEDDNTSLQDIVERQKEASSILDGLGVLSLINTQNSFIMDVFDNGESRFHFEKALKAQQVLRAIPKEKFNFHALSNEWQKFENVIRDILYQETQILTRRLVFPTELYEKIAESKINNARLEVLSKRIVALGAGQSSSLLALRELRNENEQRISVSKQKLLDLQNENANLERQVKNIQDSTVPTLYYSVAGEVGWVRTVLGTVATATSIITTIGGMLFMQPAVAQVGLMVGNMVARSTPCRYVHYHDKPYIKVSEMYLNGTLMRDTAQCIPTKGLYSAVYEGDDPITVSFYILPKDLPDNIILLSDFKNKISLNLPKISDLENTIRQLEQNNEINSEREMLEAEKAERTATQAQLNIEIASLEQELQAVRSKIQNSARLHEVLTQIAPLFSSIFIQQFLTAYAHYTQLTPQERDDGLFLSMQKFYIDPNAIDWSSQFAQRLGGSSTAEVYKRKAIGIDNVAFVAIKQIFALKLTPELFHEAKLMAQFSQHPNIVKFHGITQSRQSPTLSYVLVMECMKCSLYDILYDHNTSDNELPIEWRIKIALQIIAAIMCLHEAAFIHRDIKSPNILLSEDRQTAKLTDFGISKPIAAITDTVIGTACWMAPELSKGGATKATDIFALGIVLAEMVNRELPFNGNMAEYNQYQQKIQAGLLVFSNQFPALSSLGKECIKVSPSERPTAQQCHERLTNFRQ